MDCSDSCSVSLLVVASDPLSRRSSSSGPKSDPSMNLSEVGARIDEKVSIPVSVPTPGGRSSTSRPADVAAKPGLGKGIAGSTRSFTVVTVSDMKSDVKLSFVPPVNSNRKTCRSVRSLTFRSGNHGLIDVRTLDNGFFMFVYASLRLWMMFCELGPCAWSPADLSKIASAVGIPSVSRSSIANGSALVFARVRVEIDTSEEFIYESSSQCFSSFDYDRCVCSHHFTSSGLQRPLHEMPGSTSVPHAGARIPATLIGRGDSLSLLWAWRGRGGPLDHWPLSSGQSPPGTGWDLLRSPERSSDGFVAVTTKPPSKRGGGGRGRGRSLMISSAAWNVRGLNLLPRRTEVVDLRAGEGIVARGLAGN
ncbi:hypothetical protein Dimus_005548 [Dionaea muscipula]